MGYFGAAHAWGGAKKAPLPKICSKCPTMMKLGTVITYLKESKKYIDHVMHPFSFADIGIFYKKSANFANSRNIDIDSIQIRNF